MKLQGIRCGALLAMVVIGVLNIGAVDGAVGIYVFGDSYMDTGNSPQVLNSPYGSTWPGFPDHRWSDGRVQADYFAKLFNLPTPTPFVQRQNLSQALQGINFAVGGGSVTYGYGISTLGDQVGNMEALVANGTLTKPHLRNSVGIISAGLNDYGSRNLGAPFLESAFTKELNAFVASVVDGIALSIVRLNAIGIRHIVVANLPYMECIPLSIMELAYTGCSTNSTYINQTLLHDSLLHKRVKGLNQQLPSVRIIIVDQTKAFKELISHPATYGFVDPLVPCCHGNGTNLYPVVCGKTDNEGRPLYTECEDPSKAVLFDTIHPTDAAWKAIINLYASVSGFTLEGPKLNTWIRKYNVAKLKIKHLPLLSTQQHCSMNLGTNIVEAVGSLATSAMYQVLQSGDNSIINSAGLAGVLHKVGEDEFVVMAVQLVRGGQLHLNWNTLENIK